MRAYAVLLLYRVLNLLRLMIRLFAAFCLTCLSFASIADSHWLDEYAAEIERESVAHNIPGYAFVYLQKGKPAQIYTFGKTERKGHSVNEQTVFRLASVSKTFTAVLMARLVEQKKLDWQTSVSTLAPEFGFSQAGMDGLNLRHLVSQSSGYTPNAYDNLIEANYPVKRILNKLADLEPLCSPGNCYTYQNALFGVLEHYFETNQTSYRHELENNIFEPLAMPNASAGKASLLSAPNWAKPHIAMSRKSWRKGTVKNSYYKFSPAAGVNASITDMEVWLRAMLGEYPHQITPELVDEVTTPLVKTKRELNRRQWKQHLRDAHYGLGWRVYDFEGNKLNYHGGWVQGYRADVAFSPEYGVGYAMLMNAESNLINGFTADFWHRFFNSQDAKQLMAKIDLSTSTTTTD